MEKSVFGKNLKALRESRAVTQVELADAIGVTSMTISNWESRGIGRPKNKDTIDRLCEVLDCSESDLFGISDGYYEVAVLKGRKVGAKGRLLEHEDGGTVYAPPELCSRGNYFATMGDLSMGKRIPLGCNVLIDIYAEPSNDDIVLVSVDSCKPELRTMHEFDGVYVFTPDTWEEGFSRFVVDTKDKNAPRMQILGVVRYMCMEVGHGQN